MSTIKSRKPAPFIAPNSQIMTTQTELSKREQKAEMLKKIGENPSLITEEEIENPYRVKAMVLIQQDKEIPDELLAQIEQYDREVIHAEKKI
ncbi:MAG: hypothetical protein IJ716_08650 [Lachnospiraceae bacterium]|nr:hypothetical protein [Lachnospiraceae bacterium]